LSRLVGTASAYASATVVNAIATGRGAAFGVDLKVHARVELIPGSKRITGELVDGKRESPRLIETCVKKVLRYLRLEGTYGATVKTKSEFPIAVGLSSSSAAANAAVLATFAALGKSPPPELVLDLGIDAAFEAGVTITGALDDAAASLYGRGVVTDNTARKVLKFFDLDPRLKILIHVPPGKFYTSRIRRERLREITDGVEFAHEMAMRGDVFGALSLNGMLYSSALGHDPLPALEAIAGGALASGLTGTGPAVVAVAKPGDVGRIERAWRRRTGKIIITKPASKL